MSKTHPKHIRLRDLLLFLVLVTPTVGQFTLPFLYMPLRRLFPTRLTSSGKQGKVTTEHIKILSGWSLEKAHSETLADVFTQLVRTDFYIYSFTAADLVDLNYHWSYQIPFDSLNSSFSIESVASTLNAADFQQEFLKFTSEKFLFSVNNVASRLGIPAINLSRSYDPGDWDTVVHAMIMESSMAYSNKLQLPSVDALAQLVKIETQELLSLNLSTFEALVFPFPPKKAILDTNTTSMIFNSSGISEALYAESTLIEALKHEEIKLSPHQFAILYNISNEQVKTLDRSTLNQIYHMCKSPMKAILNLTLPDASRKVVGSESHTPPCPVLINIKGNSMSSFQNNPVIIAEEMTVLNILTTVANLPWFAVRWSVDASLSDWEILDAVTLPQLAGISGYGVESLRNDSVSESVKLVFALRANRTLYNRTEAYRVFIRGVLKETFNLTLSEVTTLIEVPDDSLQNVSSAFLFKSFFNATVNYFKLNFSEIISALQMTEEQLHYLPRQEWNDTIPVIVDAVVQIEAVKVQMSTENLFQLLGFKSNELSISQLKELIRTRIQDVKQRKMKFENDPISWYLANNSISDADYLNTSVHTLLLSASNFTDAELKLVYDLNRDQLFILGGMRFSDLPRVCDLDTSATKERTLYNITKELVGIRESRALCKTTKFYVEARHRNLSYLQTAFSFITNSTTSFVHLTEMVTRLPWRQNVWAFDLKMEDWRVLYVLNQDTFREDTGFTKDEFLSKTLLQVFQRSLQFQTDNDPKLRVRENQSREPTLNILYDLFNTNEDDLIRFSGKSKAEYDVLFPIEVVPLVYKYLGAKFNVSMKTLEASLNLKPGDLDKLAPTEWSELIPLVKAEVIRSDREQLGVNLSNFAKLLLETSASLLNLTLAQMESKWDNTFTRLMKGKTAMEKESLLQILTSIGVKREIVEEVTILIFIENRINLTKSELLLLYNFSSTGIEVLGNYTFKELPEYCELSKEDLYNKRPHDIVVSLLGHNNDVKCRKIALLVAAATISVDELATKFSLNVRDGVSMLTMFEDLFQVPWPKIAWAVNASLADWPVLGATSLSNISNLLLETADNLKRLKSFREITIQLLAVPQNSYTLLLNDYRSELKSKASNLLNVNSSKVCNGCNIVNILWNSLTQLNSQIDFDIHILPNKLNVSPYEFNLTLPSRWSLMVFPIVRDVYAQAARALGMDSDRFSTLLGVRTKTIQNMTLKKFEVFLEQSIRPFIAAKTALTKMSFVHLITVKGKDFAVLRNETVFDVIDSLISVPIQNVSFIFNWTARQQAKLKNYTLDDMVYYRAGGLLGVGSASMFNLVSFILRQTLPPRTPSPPTLSPCKQGFDRVVNDTKCIGKVVFDFLLNVLEDSLNCAL